MGIELRFRNIVVDGLRILPSPWPAIGVAEFQLLIRSPCGPGIGSGPYLVKEIDLAASCEAGLLLKHRIELYSAETERHIPRVALLDTPVSYTHLTLPTNREV